MLCGTAAAPASGTCGNSVTCDGSNKYGTCVGTDWQGVTSYPPQFNYASMDGQQLAATQASPTF